MKPFYFLLAFGLCFCHGEKNADRQQVVKNYRSGKRMLVYSMLDGKLDGTYTWYAESGPALMMENYVAGLTQGKSFQYDSSGWLKSEFFYVDNVMNGPFRFFFPNGNIQTEGTMLGKKKAGIEKHYYSTGQIFQVRDHRTSPSKIVEYYRNGHRRITGQTFGKDFEGPVFLFDSVATDSVQATVDHGKLRALK